MESIIPDKNLFIVTSALEPRVGVITKEDREREAKLAKKQAEVAEKYKFLNS